MEVPSGTGAVVCAVAASAPPGDVCRGLGGAEIEDVSNGPPGSLISDCDPGGVAGGAGFGGAIGDTAVAGCDDVPPTGFPSATSDTAPRLSTNSNMLRICSSGGNASL